MYNLERVPKSSHVEGQSTPVCHLNVQTDLDIQGSHMHMHHPLSEP